MLPSNACPLLVQCPGTPQDTVRLLRALQAGQPAPSQVAAAAVGCENVDKAVGDDGAGGENGGDGSAPVEVNEEAVEMLKRLPGINAHNWRKVSEAAGTLQELSSMSMKKLCHIKAKEIISKSGLFYNHYKYSYQKHI